MRRTASDTELTRAAWTEVDRELAATLWEGLSEPAKALFSILIDHPDQKFSGDDLAARLGLANGRQSLAGVFGWPGRYGKAIGRTWPWSWEYPKGETARYWMTPEIAGIFRLASES